MLDKAMRALKAMLDKALRALKAILDKAMRALKARIKDAYKMYSTVFVSKRSRYCSYHALIILFFFWV